MTGEPIPLPSEEHQALRELLPWYVTGTLDAQDQARVEAHVGGCAECQADVRFQQRLESEVARLPLDVEAGWAQMRRRLAAEAPRPVAAGLARLSRQGAPWLGWGVAASLMLVTGVTLLPSPAPDAYHTLSSAPAARTGNLVVVFHPDTTERAMRETLKAGEARLVDGPTAAGGYILQAPPARRAAALATLRARPEIVLAEPIDPNPINPAPAR